MVGLCYKSVCYMAYLSCVCCNAPEMPIQSYQRTSLCLSVSPSLCLSVSPAMNAAMAGEEGGDSLAAVMGGLRMAQVTPAEQIKRDKLEMKAGLDKEAARNEKAVREKQEEEDKEERAAAAKREEELGESKGESKSESNAASASASATTTTKAKSDGLTFSMGNVSGVGIPSMPGMTAGVPGGVAPAGSRHMSALLSSAPSGLSSLGSLGLDGIGGIDGIGGMGGMGGASTTAKNGGEVPLFKIG